jgi:ComF family protein
MRTFLDLLAPVACVSCGATGDAELCVRCATQIRPVARPWCSRCGAPSASDVCPCIQCRDLEGFRTARSVVVFAEPARGLTLALKRRGRRVLARSIGTLVAALAEASGLATGLEVVTFVPGSRRARKLGFDHTELIARATARILGSPARKILIRRNDGPRQSDVPFAQRRDNVRQRFAARAVRGPVLLIDDVYTTGATAEACSIALLRAGASSVDVLTWARTLRRRAS